VLPFAHQNINTAPSIRLGWPILGSFVIHAVLFGVILFSAENPAINNKSRLLTIQLEKNPIKNSQSANNIQANTHHQSLLKPTLAEPTTHDDFAITGNKIEATPAAFSPLAMTENSATNNFKNDTAPQPTQELTTNTLAEALVKSVESDEQAPLFDAKILNNPKPIYPLFAKKRLQEGTVLLKVKVSRDGVAETVELAQSSGFPLLDNAAQQTVKSWRFIPARRDNIEVSAWVIVPILFKQT
jgi:TonB family protein